MSHIQIRIDPLQKEAAQKTLQKMGLTLSGAVKLFLLKVVEEQKLPFEITALHPTDTLKFEPEITQAPELPPLKEVPVQTWNPFKKRSIG